MLDFTKALYDPADDESGPGLDFSKMLDVDEDEIRRWLKSFYTGKKKIEDIPITPYLLKRYQDSAMKPEQELPEDAGLGIKKTLTDIPKAGATALGALIREGAGGTGSTAAWLMKKVIDPLDLEKKFATDLWRKEQVKKYGKQDYSKMGGIGPAQPDTPSEAGIKGIQKAADVSADFWEGAGLKEEEHPLATKIAKGLGSGTGMLPGMMYPGGIIITPTLQSIKQSEEDKVPFAEGAKEAVNVAMQSALTDMVFRGIHRYPRAIKVKVGGATKTFDLRGLKRVATGFGFASTHELNKAIQTGEITKPNIEEAVASFTTGLLLPGHKDKELQIKKMERKFRRPKARVTKNDAKYIRDQIDEMIAQKGKAAYEEVPTKQTLIQPEEAAPAKEAVATLVAVVKKAIPEIKAKRVVAKRPKPVKAKAEPEKSIYETPSQIAERFSAIEELLASKDPNERREGVALELKRRRYALENIKSNRDRKAELKAEEIRVRGMSPEEIMAYDFAGTGEVAPEKVGDVRKQMVRSLEVIEDATGPDSEFKPGSKERAALNKALLEIRAVEDAPSREAAAARIAQIHEALTNPAGIDFNALAGKAPLKPATKVPEKVVEKAPAIDERTEYERELGLLSEGEAIKRVQEELSKPKLHPAIEKRIVLGYEMESALNNPVMKLLDSYIRKRGLSEKVLEAHLEQALETGKGLDIKSLATDLARANFVSEIQSADTPGRKSHADRGAMKIQRDLNGILARYNPKFKQMNAGPNLEQAFKDLWAHLTKPKLAGKFTYGDWHPSNPQFEESFNNALVGKKRPALAVRDFLADMKHKITRKYEHLPNKPEFRTANFHFRAIERSKTPALENAAGFVFECTKDLKPEEYTYFMYKILFNDLKWSIDNGRFGNEFGLTEAEVLQNSASLDAFLASRAKPMQPRPNIMTRKGRRALKSKDAEFNGQAVLDAVAKRKEGWDWLRGQYIDAYKDVGLDISDTLSNPDYYPHLVIEKAQESFNNKVSGSRSKAPKSPHLWERKGYEGSISTNYLEAEGRVLAQIFYNISIARNLAEIQRVYDVSGRAKDEAKQLGVTYEEVKAEYMKNGYDTFQPHEGNMYYRAMMAPESILKQLADMGATDIPMDALREVIAKGSRKKEWLVKKELADTLSIDMRTKVESDTVAAFRKTLTGWKVWTLVQPRKFFKYNFRNFTGDIEPVIVANIKAFNHVGESVKDIREYAKTGKFSDALKVFFNYGGMSSTLQANDIMDIAYSKKFAVMNARRPLTAGNALPRAISAYFRGAMRWTNYRETILRYANFLEYRRQIEANVKAGKGAVPENYGASDRKSIDSLKTADMKAYELANDLLGAYDRVGVAGQGMRKVWYPFWSWKEANARRYFGIMRNVAHDPRISARVGKGLLGATTASLFTAMRIGSLAIRINAGLVALQMFNNAVCGDLEKEIPEDIRSKPHITFPFRVNGEVVYFSRIGAIPDLLEWIGMDFIPSAVADVLNGGRTLKEMAQEIAKIESGEQTTGEWISDEIDGIKERGKKFGRKVGEAATGTEVLKSTANVMASGTNPYFKTLLETGIRKELYPDMFKARTMRDVPNYLARSLGLEPEFRALTNRPGPDYLDTIPGIILYSIAPNVAAYGEFFDIKNRRLKEWGEDRSGFPVTAKGALLYNYKLALKYDKPKIAEIYRRKYLDMDGTPQGMDQSMRAMHPLFGISKNRRKEFFESLDEDEMEIYERAMRFYEEVLLAGHEFSDKGTGGFGGSFGGSFGGKY
jgi:hypothetical protein